MFSAGDGLSIRLHANQPQWYSIAPGQLVALSVRITITPPACSAVDAAGVDTACPDVLLPASGCSLAATVIVSGTRASDNQTFSTTSIPLSLRCRSIHDAFLFTFIDHDGSVQSAAAVAPLGRGKEIVPLPVVLSLHGTGVTAQSQAEAYKVCMMPCCFMVFHC